MLLALAPLLMASATSELLGQASCWGDSSNKASSLAVPADLGLVRQVAAFHHACAITEAWEVRCWGQHYTGSGSIYQDNVPPTGLGTVKKLVAFRDGSCVITQADRVTCWGASSAINNVPADLGTVLDISVDQAHACALKTDRKMSCWGSSAGSPQVVPPSDTDTLWKTLACGAHNTCGVTMTDELICWGHTSFIDPGTTTGIAKISARVKNFCLLTDAGDLDCFGKSGYESDESKLPALDAGEEIAVPVASYAYACVITTLHKLKCWGKDAAVTNGALPVPSDVAAGYVFDFNGAGKVACAVWSAAPPTTATVSTSSVTSITVSTSTSTLTVSSTSSTSVSSSSTSSSTLSASSTSSTSETATTSSTSTETVTTSTETATTSTTSTETSTFTTSTTTMSSSSTSSSSISTSSSTSVSSTSSSSLTSSTSSSVSTSSTSSSSVSSSSTSVTSSPSSTTSVTSSTSSSTTSMTTSITSTTSSSSSSSVTSSSSSTISATTSTSSSTTSMTTSKTLSTSSSSSSSVTSSSSSTKSATVSTSSSTTSVTTSRTSATSSSSSSSATSSTSATSTGSTSTWRSSTLSSTLAQTSTATATSSTGTSTTGTSAALDALFWPCLMITALVDAETERDMIRGLELFAVCSVPELSEYDLSSEIGSISLPSGSLAEGAFFYVASESRPGAFAHFFGFPCNVSSPPLVGGSGYAVLSRRGLTIDAYGRTGVAGAPWSLYDSFAYRRRGLPRGGFDPSEWEVRDRNTLEGFSRNADSGGRAIVPVGSFGTRATHAALAAEVGAKAAGRAAVLHLVNKGLQSAMVATEAGNVSVFQLSAVPSVGPRLSLTAGTDVVASLHHSTLASKDAIVTVHTVSLDTPTAAGPLAGNENTRAALGAVRGKRGEFLALQPVDFSLYDASGKSLQLTEPALIKIPSTAVHDPPGAGLRQECAYLEFEDGQPFWSREGLWRATAEEVRAAGGDPGDGFWCWTRHFSIFAAIWQAVLGCTNMELLTEGGFAAVARNEHWLETRPVRIISYIGLGCLVMILLGNGWETWAFRLGQTYAPGKKVHLCKNVLTANIKMIKYRYTAFLVYAKEVLSSLRAGRHTLRRSTLTSGVQRFLGLRTGISVGCVSQHLWSGGGWIDSPAALPKSSLCRKLEFHSGAAEDVLARYMVGSNPLQMLRRLVMTFLAVHPVLDAMRVGAGSMTVAKRTTLQIAAFSGVLAANSMIFNFSGEFQSWEAEAECPIKSTSLWFILVATLVSIILNAVPNAFLLSVAKQVHGRPAWLAFFWAITALYLLWSLLLLALALANLNEKDQAKWVRSLEWACLVKFLVMPLAQTGRHWLFLEGFLIEDRRLEPSKQFPVLMGLKHHSEAVLSAEATQEAERMAKQAISAEELVRFTSLLGEFVMVDFDPETATSEDVMAKAIKPLCCKPPTLKDIHVFVQVLEVTGLPGRVGGELSCSVLHLGRQRGKERPCLFERSGAASAVLTEGSAKRCAWRFSTSVFGLELEHAVAFVVRNGCNIVGVAWLDAHEVLGADNRTLALRLYPTGGSSNLTTGSFHTPSGEEEGDLGFARLQVALRLPTGCEGALGHNELWKLKSAPLEKQPTRDLPSSEEKDVMQEARFRLIQSFSGTDWQVQGPNKSGNNKRPVRSGAFCELYQQDTLPPDTMVVHSRKGNFLHLVCTVLSDALKIDKGYEMVECKVKEREFHALLELLQKKQCEDTRYWIEMFAMDLTDFEQEDARSTHWHEDLLPCLPTVMRSMRREACQRAVAEIKEGREGRSGPMKQLLVLDQRCQLLHEKTCLSEMMLAKAMCVRQCLALHPEHLHGTTIGDEMHRLAQHLTGHDYAQEVPWTLPYLANKPMVFDTIRELVVAGVVVVKGNDESTWKELNMTDVIATVVAAEAARASVATRQEDVADTRNEGGDVADGDGDIDVDV